jgi:hypothetical protein
VKREDLAVDDHQHSGRSRMPEPRPQIGEMPPAIACPTVGAGGPS